MRLIICAALMALMFTGCASREFKEMLVVGDKISAHAPAPDLGWQNDWGMSATAKNKDYVHRLYAHLKDKSPELKLTIDSIMYQDEMTGWVHLVPNNADLIIIQLSENYKGGISPKEYGEAYLQMINELRDGKEKTIVCLGPWSRTELEKTIAAAAAKGKAIYVSLAKIYADPSNRVYREKIGSVPNDFGMEKIAEAVYQAIHK